MKPPAVHGFVEDRARIRRLAQALEAPFGFVDLHLFPDRETLPTVPLPEGRSVVLYRSLHDPNARLLPILLTADAYRRAGVRRLVLVAPYLCYMRQDAVFAPGQPVSRDVVCALLGQAFDAVVTVQAHMHRTTDLSAALGRPAVNLDIGTALARRLGAGPGMLIVGPDRESAPWVEAAARDTGSEACTFTKHRHGDRSVALTLPAGAACEGRAVILLDDVCASGGTLEAAVGLLVGAGAASVDVGVAHALFDDATEARLRAAGARNILSSDSIPHPSNALDLAPRLARALQDENLA